MTMAKVSDYLKADRVVFLNASTREEAIDSLFNVVEEQKLVENIDQFKNSINEREKVVTTGIGMGVAIPHAKLPDYNDFFIIVGILSQGIPWDALDGTHVRTILMIDLISRNFSISKPTANCRLTHSKTQRHL